jgi:arylformamidase
MAPAAEATRTSSPATTGWIDISVPIYDGMVHWPDNPPIAVYPVMQLERGDLCTLSALEMGAHTGTHIDAPVHFIRGGAGTDAVPLDRLMGPARVVPIENPRAVTLAELRERAVGPGERLLFKTLNSQRCWNGSEFIRDSVSLAEDAAKYLADLETLAVGIDYLSVGSPAVHRALFGGEVAIIEGLDLSDAALGEYELICVPLRIPGSDGAPARALLRPTAVR